MASKYLSGALVALGILSVGAGFAMVGQLPKEKTTRPRMPQTVYRLESLKLSISDIEPRLNDKKSSLEKLSADSTAFRKFTHERDSLTASTEYTAEKADYQNALAEIDKKNQEGKTSAYVVVGLLGAGVLLAGTGTVIYWRRKD